MFASVVNGSILIPCKKEKIALKTTVSAALVNLVTNFAAIPLFQQNGAAATTVLSEMVVLMVGWKYARSLVKMEKMTRVVVTSLVGCGAMVIISCVLEMIIANTALLMVLKVALCAACYLVLLSAMGNEVVASSFKQMRSKLRRFHMKA